MCTLLLSYIVAKYTVVDGYTLYWCDGSGVVCSPAENAAQQIVLSPRNFRLAEVTCSVQEQLSQEEIIPRFHARIYPSAPVVIKRRAGTSYLCGSSPLSKPAISKAGFYSA